ncbi:MAG: Ig-like domain-containing protein [Catonella sp.]|nr:Ig-like domain-containing protein [Catonella sp.]MDY6356275.1 Ig-like domain-containing protein [Catonella sp.]
MKNFVKKLSFVLAAAMVVTSVAVPVSASAATKGVTARYAGQKKSSTVVTSKTIWAGGKKVNFDYVYGKKTSGVKGTWTSSDPSVVTVDSATGKATALKKGDVTVTFTPKSKKYAAVKVAVKARVRATSIILHDGADRTAPVVTNAALKVGESKTYYAELRTKTGTKSSYFVKAATSNASAAAVKNGAEDGSYKGDNYGRNVTVTANATGSSVVTLVASPYSDDRTSTYDVKAEFPVTVKTVVSTSPVYQTEAREITVSGVASGTSLVVVKGEQFVSQRQKTEVLKTTANADGTNDVVLKLKDDILTDGSVYTVFTAAGVKVGAFVYQSEKVAGIKLDDSYVKINASKAKQAIAKVKLTNQWGNAFKASATNSVVATGAGKSADNIGYASSPYSDNKLEEGVVYFTVESNKTNAKGETLDFTDGDAVDVTVVTTSDNQKFVQTATLTVSGKAEVSKTSLYTLSFSGDKKEAEDGHVYTEDDMKGAPNLKFFVAFEKGKAPLSIKTDDVKVYLDGDTTKVLKLDSTGMVRDEKLSTNGEYTEKDITTYGNAEFVGTVDLKSADIKAGTHTVTVEYGGAKLVNTIVLLKDSSKTAAPSKAASEVTGAALSLEKKAIDTANDYNFSRTNASVTASVTDDNYNYFADITIAATDFKTDESATFGSTPADKLFKVRLNLTKDSASVDSFTKLFKPVERKDKEAKTVWDASIDKSANTLTITKTVWTADNKSTTLSYIFDFVKAKK